MQVFALQQCPALHIREGFIAILLQFANLRFGFVIPLIAQTLKKDQGEDVGLVILACRAVA